MPRRSANRSTAISDAVAARIAAERVAAEMTYEDTAKALAEVGCTLHASAIWRIEKGEPRRPVHVDEAIAFAQVFDIPLTSLLHEPFDPVDAARRRCERIMREATAP